MFYTYSQNNSGGHMEFDASSGISHYVIIEADDAKHADYLAGRIGLYFDGVEAGMDCECCGDRWTARDSYWRGDEGDEVPTIYGEPVDKHELSWRALQKGYPEVFVHYADGTVKGFLD